ncbi:MAG TPA: type II secretion system F family protein [Armatimonadota bacterium]|jgi:tight adherence protein C|nr:type II secretion system F family protein [Armatimonadota bacterium]HOJ21784.1 type II secretion system F family protein [Armatimonadota bacterium]HOM81534.1 type II secretion system F family protein [Armatimonadota bacterium]HPO71976.1 type II secretion system F family protein [Armatimonadota bacterium]HPT98175.1 type II secretion system F family protein [Armatimonadota bacterium]
MWIAVLIAWTVTLAVGLFFLVTRTDRDIALGRLEEVTEGEIARIAREERARDLSGSPARRLMETLFAPIGEFVKRISSIGGDVEGRLIGAGLTGSLTVGEFVGIKVVALLVLGATALIALPYVRAMGEQSLLLALFALPLAGFVGPDLVLNYLVRARKRMIRKRLVDALDLIVLSMEAGVGFEGALARTAEKIRGPISEELSQMLGEINHGKARADAFSDMAARVQLAELSLLVAAINQADRLGTGIADSLRGLASNLRERNIQIAREAAAKLSVKMVFPLVLFIFPALFIVILGPAIISVIESGGLF